MSFIPPAFWPLPGESLGRGHLVLERRQTMKPNIVRTKDIISLKIAYEDLCRAEVRLQSLARVYPELQEQLKLLRGLISSFSQE